MRRRAFLKGVCSVAAAPLLARRLVAGAGERRANVILIMTDQQFGDAMSCRMGSQYLHTPDDWRRQRWGYYRMIEKVDAEIGKVLEALRKTGQEDNTLIVFTSDHGECAGAHRFNQKTVFYEESARVPLIVAWKGHTAAGTCDKLVNTGIDILPTLLD